MANAKNAEHEKKRRIKQQIKKLERINDGLVREIRQLEKVRWIANDTALAYLYQIRTQFDRNDRHIDRLYTDAGRKRPTEASNGRLALYFAPVVAAFVALISIT